jgi:hypothetical protein
MSILLYVLIAGSHSACCSCGLGWLIVEHFSSTPQVTIADESISEAATQMAKLDRAMNEPVQKARELGDTCDGYLTARPNGNESGFPRRARGASLTH